MQNDCYLSWKAELSSGCVLAHVGAWAVLVVAVQEEERKRHLLRMWITPEQGWPLPEQFADRYHTVEIGNRGGIFCPDAAPYVPLDPFQ